MIAKQVSKAKTNGAVGPGSSEPFTYTTHAGIEITVSSLAKPFKTAGELRAMRGANPIDLAYYVIERDLDKKTLEKVFPDDPDLPDAMGMDEFNNDFSRQWAEHSGITLGE